MKYIYKKKGCKNILVTIAIGDRYLNDWTLYSYPSWNDYCVGNDLGLLVITDSLIDNSDSKYKKPTWQKGLLGHFISENFPEVENVCYLDTDIIISPMAPNVFDVYNQEGIGLVSLRKNIPFPYELVRRRIAHLRNKHYSSDYPLDSSLFISLDNLCQFHGKTDMSDEACMGVILFNVVKHGQILLDSFNEYSSDVDSITGGGDQFHYNYEFQSRTNVQWLPYEFQAIWCHEMAWHYPHLYTNTNNDYIKDALEATLMRTHFLHFAGSWPESDLWRTLGIFEGDKLSDVYHYKKYLSQEVLGLPVGRNKP